MVDLVLHPRGKSIPGTYRSTERKESVSWWLLKKKKKKEFHFDLRTNLPFVLVCKFLFFSMERIGIVSIERMFRFIYHKIIG